MGDSQPRLVSKFALSINSLANLLNGRLSFAGDEKVIVTGVTDDSRRCKPGDVFVAIVGSKSNGLEHLAEALDNGAVAVVSQQELSLKVAAIEVSDARRALSTLAATLHDHPSNTLVTIGITGTNGKTTTNWVIYNLLLTAKAKAIRIGTLGVEAAGISMSSDYLTTPGALEVQSLLAAAVRQDIKYAVLEISSHALQQHRCDDLAFDVAVFTNLTQDHLDYHKTFEHYQNAKRKLFELLAASSKPQRCGVINISDPVGAQFYEQFSPRVKLITYGWSKAADVQIVDRGSYELHYDGAAYKLPETFLGKHNAENLAAAFATAIALGLDPATIITALAACPQVPGRLERLGRSELEVLVDFAHTPDALENVLRSLRPACRGKLWVVFGCGGDRDRSKRPKMGAIAARLADQVLITSDNPRTEDAAAIIDEVLAGCSDQQCETEIDRKVAIEQAILRAAPDDMVLIAGKGHEEYQIIGSERLPFSDRTIAQAALIKRASFSKS